HLHGGMPQGLTVHVVGRDRDLTFDLDGGNRIPKAAERLARSIADLRAAGIGVRRILLVHDGTRSSSDVFEWLLTMLSSSAELDVVRVRSLELEGTNGHDTFVKDRQWAEQLGRTLKVLSEEPQSGAEIVRMSREGNYDAIVLPAPSTKWPPTGEGDERDWMSYVVSHAPCSVFIAVHPTIPREVVG
ncbi:MAG TPA: universal stress protein, partial [Lacipirellulaceae bacterium]|nr:universal stress protein [Lacipirellulaceae bacterium]